MKLSHFFLSAVVLVISSSNTVVFAQEGEAVETDAAVEEEVVEKEEFNCDEICASQVAEATRVVNIEKDDLEKQLNPLKAALEQAKDASVAAAAEVTALQGQLATMEKAVEAAKSEVVASRLAASEVEAAANNRIAAMKTELEEAEAKVEQFQQTKFFINKDLIKAEFMGLLKQYGLVKDKEEEL